MCMYMYVWLQLCVGVHVSTSVCVAQILHIQPWKLAIKHLVKESY